MFEKILIAIGMKKNPINQVKDENPPEAEFLQSVEAVTEETIIEEGVKPPVYTPPTMTSRLTCGCRGCGNIVPANTEIVMTNRGPFHVECLQKNGNQELDFQLDGKIVISPERTGIEYYSLGGCFIKGEALDQVAKAIRLNWIEYERMKSKVPPGVTVEKEGVLGMTIRISSLDSGVWLHSNRLGVRNENEANRLAGEYERAFTLIQDLRKIVRNET